MTFKGKYIGSGLLPMKSIWWYFITADHYIPNLFIVFFFPFLDKAVLLSLTTFPFILNVLTSLRIAFIQKVETF